MLVRSVTFAQRRNRLTTNFSKRIPVVKQRISVINMAVQKSGCLGAEMLKYMVAKNMAVLVCGCN